MATNRRLVSNDGLDFYPTPAWGTEALLKYEQFWGPIWEPACGDGAMSEVLKAYGYTVNSTNIINRGYGEAFFDFLESDCVPAITNGFSNIVTNPPFNIANDFVLHSIKLIERGKVCMLLRTAFLESVKRYETIFKDNPPARVYVFSQRLSMYPAGHPVKGGGTTSYSWFVWDVDKSKEKPRTPIPPQIHWIEPGLKRT